VSSAAESARPARSALRLTTAGRAFLPFALAALFAGWGLGGTGGLLGATALALCACAPPLAWLHARSLAVAPPSPARVFAGESFVLWITVRNRSRLFTARDLLFACGPARGRARRPGGHLPCLRAGEERHVAVAHRLPERGRVRALPLALESAWPLGLVRCRLEFELPVDLLALPRLGSLGDLGRLPAGRARLQLDNPRRASGDEEFRGVREWRAGEGQRRVHWKLSARRGRTILREYERESEAPVHLVLATRAAGAAARVPAFERAVSLCATVAEHFLRRGRRVRLTLAGDARARIDAPRGRVGLLRALAALAEVAREEGEPFGVLAAELSAAARRGEVPIGIVAGRRARAAAVPGALVLDVDDPSLERFFHPGRPHGVRPLLAAGAGE